MNEKRRTLFLASERSKLGKPMSVRSGISMMLLIVTLLLGLSTLGPRPAASQDECCADLDSLAVAIVIMEGNAKADSLYIIKIEDEHGAEMAHARWEIEALKRVAPRWWSDPRIWFMAGAVIMGLIVRVIYQV